jgi:pyruvate kinase
VETVGEVIVKGTGVGKNAASGKAFIVKNEKDLEKFEEGQVLVARSTGLDYLPAIKKASALVAEEGGLTSHAAIVAINLGKPAVVGAEKATVTISNDEMITVDAIRGLIYRGQAHVL